ncbi:MAG: mechanosensitive ion channel domain-containing protein [Bdellovibrio sp.]
MGENLLIKNLYPLLTPEAFFLIQALLGLSWIFYRVFLKEVSPERHLSLRKSYRKLLRLTLVFAIFFGIYFALSLLGEWELGWAHRLKPYFALLAFFLGLMVLIRGSRLLLLQYLFLGSMTAGVPILIVNIFSLALTLALLVWSASHVFGIQLGPLLATSAVFSIILGLALQDTLGNIFSGIALQIDKSFEIGDWLEIVNGSQKIIGQVQEITWRSTILIGWSDEIITLPNRSIANWQISNFANGRIPILRSQSFRVDHFEDLGKIRRLLLECLNQVPGIPSHVKPICFISESTDSWVNFKLVYGIESYGKQFVTGDLVIEAAMKHLGTHGVNLTPQKFSVKVQSS